MGTWICAFFVCVNGCDRQHVPDRTINDDWGDALPWREYQKNAMVYGKPNLRTGTVYSRLPEKRSQPFLCVIVSAASGQWRGFGGERTEDAGRFQLLDANNEGNVPGGLIVSVSTLR